MDIVYKKKNAVISVQDNGMDISPGDTLSELFKPFTQADHSLDRHENGGLGLALSNVKGIVDMSELSSKHPLTADMVCILCVEFFR